MRRPRWPLPAPHSSLALELRGVKEPEGGLVLGVGVVWWCFLKRGPCSTSLLKKTPNLTAVKLKILKEQP